MARRNTQGRQGAEDGHEPSVAKARPNCAPAFGVRAACCRFLTGWDVRQRQQAARTPNASRGPLPTNALAACYHVGPVVTHVTHLTPRLWRYCAGFFDARGVKALVSERAEHRYRRHGDERADAVKLVQLRQIVEEQLEDGHAQQA